MEGLNRHQLNNISPPQRELFKILIQIFPDAELEYKIGGRIKKKGYNARWADMGIPSLKIDFEYDGWERKTMSFEDERRDEELSAQGWKTIRISKEKLSLIKNNFQMRKWHKKNNDIDLENKDQFLEFINKLDGLVGLSGL